MKPLKPIRVAHRWLAALVAAAIGVQFLLAGAGAFHATSFDPHTGLGWMIAAASLLVLLAALLGRSELTASGLLFAAVAVQVALGVLGAQSSPWFGALHGLNALVAMGAAANLARRTAGRVPATQAHRSTAAAPNVVSPAASVRASPPGS
jgi:ABC-type multidrug transport system permease subunit